METAVGQLGRHDRAVAVGVNAIEPVEGPAVFIVPPAYPAVSPPVLREMQVPYLSHIDLPEERRPALFWSDGVLPSFALVRYFLSQYLSDGRPLYVPDGVLVRKAFESMIVTREASENERFKQNLVAELNERVASIVARDYHNLPVLVIEDTVRQSPHLGDGDAFPNTMRLSYFRLTYFRLIAVDKLTRVKARLLG